MENMTEHELIECAKRIVLHLEKNIVKHRDNPSIAHKLASMNKYIHMCYIQRVTAL